MTDAFSADELLDMVEAQEGHMMDECVLRIYSGSQDTYGEVVPTFIDGAATICGLEMKGGEIKDIASKTITLYDAKIRLPKTLTFSLRDRIKITKRFGSSVTPIEYAIVSTHSIGPSGMQLLLQKITT